MGHRDRELVAAQPPHHVAGAHQPLEPAGHDDDGVVADDVAEGVVDRLEPVEVDVADADRGAVGGDVLETGEEVGPVGQPAEVVVVGEVLELAEVVAPLEGEGDRLPGPPRQGLHQHRAHGRVRRVLHDHGGEAAAGVDDRHRDARRRAEGLGLGHERRWEGVEPRPRRLQGAHGHGPRRGGVRVDLPVAPDAGEGGWQRTRADAGVAVVVGDDERTVRRAAEAGGEVHEAGAEGLAGGQGGEEVPVGVLQADVAHDHRGEPLVGIATLEGQREGRHLGRQPGAVATPQPHHAGPGPGPLGDAGEVHTDAVEVVGVDEVEHVGAHHVGVVRAQDGRRRRVRVLQDPGLVEDHHALAALFHDRPQPGRGFGSVVATHARKL